MAILPVESAVTLPREKRIPEPKPETKWEKYAKEKNIKNKKRDRMLFDETTEDWKPRYGYKRIKNGVEDIPIVEIKNGSNPFEDPWAKERLEKKQRVSKNLINQEKNQIRNGKKTASFGKL